MKHYIRFPFIMKISILSFLVLAGKFTKQATVKQPSGHTVTGPIYQDSLQAKTINHTLFFENVNWASER